MRALAGQRRGPDKRERHGGPEQPRCSGGGARPLGDQAGGILGGPAEDRRAGYHYVYAHRRGLHGDPSPEKRLSEPHPRQASPPRARVQPGPRRLRLRMLHTRRPRHQQLLGHAPRRPAPPLGPRDAHGGGAAQQPDAHGALRRVRLQGDRGARARDIAVAVRPRGRLYQKVCEAHERRGAPQPDRCRGRSRRTLHFRGCAGRHIEQPDAVPRVLLSGEVRALERALVGQGVSRDGRDWAQPPVQGQPGEGGPGGDLDSPAGPDEAGVSGAGCGRQGQQR
mmetsp:Transcript_42137/g.105368  ORF Transcript_42137/g.105368 Transcript_42137/m.105368 type:complete len:280 (+) Transcript_42137:442-1281(+)